MQIRGISDGFDDDETPSYSQNALRLINNSSRALRSLLVVPLTKILFTHNFSLLKKQRIRFERYRRCRIYSLDAGEVAIILLYTSVTICDGIGRVRCYIVQFFISKSSYVRDI